MPIRALGTVLLAVVACLLAGCGSNDALAPDPEPQTIDLGTLQVGVASAAGFKTLSLPSPSWSSLAFTALYGSRLVGLREMGYNKIAFASNRDGDSDIYVTTVDGSSVTNLTQNSTNEYSPSWSPGGTKIAYEHVHGGDFEICTMNADGSGHTQLISNAGQEYMPAWSPDGTKIAFYSDRAGVYDIYKINADGTSAQRLTNSPEDDADPAWSPDGRLLAYTTAPASSHQLYVMNADGSGPRALTDDSAGEVYPAWSPDGQYIAYCSSGAGVGGPSDLFLMRPDGSEVTNLTNSPLGESQPAWSPDGRSLAYVVHLSPTLANLAIMNVDGSGRRSLTSTNSFDRRPAWCPVPSKKRALIGAGGSDNGANPPFGTQRPLAIAVVGLAGMVGAATVTVPEAQWGSLTVAALTDTGQALTGARITAPQISDVLEDTGSARPPRRWTVPTTPAVGAVLVFFAGDTGKIVSVIAASDESLGAEGPSAELAGGRLVLRGRFVAAFDRRAPERNLLAGPTERIALDATSGLLVQ